MMGALVITRARHLPWFAVVVTALVASTMASPALAQTAAIDPDARVVVIGGTAVVSDHVTGHFAGCLPTAPDRIAGADRYATAVRLSQDRFTAAGAVIVARGDDFPDAITGGPFAASLGGPMLLTRRDGLPGITTSEIRRLGASTAYVLGGTAAVDDSVVSQLETMGLSVVRLAGADRNGTAAAIALASHPDGAATVYIALGTSFIDALPAAPAAHQHDAPMLLTGTDVLPQATKAALAALSPDRIVIVGGTSAVSPDVASELAGYAATVDRISGGSRYSTAVAVAREAFPGKASTVYLTIGDNFPDGLAAGAIATDGPILYVDRASVSGPTARETSRHGGGDCDPYTPQRMSSFTTYHPCCQNRVTNIHLIADAVRGVIVAPGETFSVNAHVGQRTEAKGYLRDGAIIGGVVYCCDHWLNVGGGVSQYATTLFNAIFFGGYEVVEHRPHSIWFSRYPMGREATIGWTAPDLAFRNDTDEPVEIRSSYTSTSLTVEMWGDNGGRTVRDERIGTATTEEGGTVTIRRYITDANGATTMESWTHRYRPKKSDDSGGDPPPPPPPEDPDPPPPPPEPL